MREESSNNPQSIADLEPKTRLEGVVKETGLHGAVVDVGLDYDGLLHISQLASGNNVDLVTEEVQPGDQVTVWVTAVDQEQKHISLTMIEPPDVTWRELKEGRICTGTVKRIESYGAFIDVGAERYGLLHIREMSEGYVENPTEVVSVGNEVEVRILKVDQRRRRIDLTMKGLAPEVASEPEPVETFQEEEEEVPQTSMEVALQRAYDTKDKEEAKSRPEKRSADFSEQEEIMKRTLEQHADSE